MKIYFLEDRETGLLLAEKRKNFNLKNEEGFETRISLPCLTDDIPQARMFRSKFSAFMFLVYGLPSGLQHMDIVSFSEYMYWHNGVLVKGEENENK